MLADEADGRIDFERGMGYAPPGTLAIIALLVGVFVWQLQTGALHSQAGIVDAGALVRSRVLEGEHWRMLSATLLHGGFDHLIGNCVALYILGMAGEHALGTWRVLVLYVGSGLAGSLASVLTGPGPSVGASGAICGMMGAVVLILYKYRRVYHVRDKEIGFVLAGWAAYIIVMGALDPHIDNWAHFGGLLGGVMLALGVRPRVARGAARYFAQSGTGMSASTGWISRKRADTPSSHGQRDRRSG
jgi:rhomboid protease GluP